MSKPWYKNGLRFECTQCGDCCTGAPGYVWVSDEEIARLAEFLGLSVEAFQRNYVRQIGLQGKSLIEHANGDCVFFDPQTRRCGVYPARPTQCRTWPFWESNLSSPWAWRQTSKDCPGCGQGDLVPLEEIRRRASEVQV